MRGRAVAAALLLSGVALSGCAGTPGGPGEPGPARSGGAAGSARPARVALPPTGRFDYQIGGAYPPPSRTATVSRDRSDPPAPGAYSICYVNAFQTQPEETAWWRAAHPDLVLPVEDPEWPGEFLLDLSTPAKRTAAADVVGGWIDGCAGAGYQAVEPDNLDSWTRSGGRLDESDALAFVTLIATRAHGHGLAVGQKNTAELGDRGHTAGLDFAVAEECEAQSECEDYTAVYGRHVLEVEYAAKPFAAACAARRGNPVVLRDRDVVPSGHAGYLYRSC